MAIRTLIIDDDLEFLDSLKESFSSQLKLHTASTAEEADKILTQDSNWDIIVFDILMPGKSGLELYSKYKYLESSTTLILLTHLQDDLTFNDAMKLTPDDFITKPIPLDRLERLLVNRFIKKNHDRSSVHTIGDVQIHLNNGSIQRGDIQIDLTKKEWSILNKIMESKEFKVHKEEMLCHLSVEYQLSPESLNTHMSNLRKKLSQMGLNIYTNDRREVCLETL